MTATDPTELVLSIERSLPVTEWRYRDVDLWPLLRQQIWLRQHRGDSARRGGGRRGAGLGIVRDQGSWARARWSDRAHEATHGQADVVILTGGGVDRFQDADGAWFDRWGDSLGELFEQTGASVLQLDPHHSYRVPRHRPSRLIQPSLDVLKLRARLAGSGPAPREWPALEQLLARSGQAPPTRSLGPYIDLVASRFAEVLHRSGAVLAVFVDWGPTSQALAVAARRVGVLSVELQHGVHDRQHPHYGAWEALKPEGYSVHPDTYWAWRDATELVPDWAAPGQPSDVVVGGNPPLERWLRRPHVTAHSGPTRTALVTLQPGLLAAEHLHPLVDAMAAAPRDWVWWLRHHPTATAEDKQAVAELVHATGALSETEKASSAPLLERLLDADAHITVTSSAVLEASAVGRRSVLLGGREASRLFASDIAAGEAVVARSGPDLLAALDWASAARTEPRRPSELPGLTAAALLKKARHQS